MTKEALTLLVREMEYVLSCINEDKIPFDGDDFHEALRLGKEALAQPEQEPVAWAMLHDNGDFIDAINLEEHARVEGQYKHPLYTTPPQHTWVGLTDEEVRKIAYNTAELKVAKDIEAKLKEKNDC